ncbi:ATP-binding protein [Lentzea cavernae]|uniref:ATP-binding protein n=1 Tax=Lentzea cavernae TaxID=2020703 RepID=A0ABQ3MG42_9PSEU|nr:ATP-binding protein [Lentzea cavernae]GHH42082.1 hypothetical protein GCM10017774_37740 [Lentzea cavernae]
MSPRSGGESDKLGNYYEGLWIIWQMLEVIAGRAESITIEALGDLGDGAEFVLRSSNKVCLHQLKRQIGDANEWTLGTLRAKRVLKYAAQHTGQGRHFCFVSLVPARTLDELAGRAVRSTDVVSFVADLTSNKNLTDAFASLASDSDFGSEDAAWQALQRIEVSWTDERLIKSHCVTLAEVYLQGLPPHPMTLVLGEIAATSIGEMLDIATLDEKLAEHGIRRSKENRQSAARSEIDAMLATWTAGVEAELFEPGIPRAAAATIAAAVEARDCRIVFAAGVAGSGKSAVLQQAISHLRQNDHVVAAARLDRLEPFASTGQLGERFALSSSPVATLATAAAGRKCVLVIDQLDAISKASGRAPGAMDVVAALVREAHAFPEMRLIFACRVFDLDNDDRIRQLASERQTSRVEIAELAEADMQQVLEAANIDLESLGHQQKQLLRTPLNLKLFMEIGPSIEGLSFRTTKDLFDAYWDRKLADCRARASGPVRFVEVIDVLTDSMSDRQRLSAPAHTLDSGNLLPDALLLVSEHVLVRSRQQLAFFHESFFDYAFARRWMERGVDLVTFLSSGHQELFRRTQVRQILLHLRYDEPERFVAEADAVLSSPEVRFHIKDVVLSLFRTIDRPTIDEALLIEHLIDQNPPFLKQLYAVLHAPGWFRAADTAGALQTWLASNDPKIRVHAYSCLAGGAGEDPDRVAEILHPYLDEKDVRAEVVWVLSSANLSRSRRLFDAVVKLMQTGLYEVNDFDLWHVARSLPEHQPGWAVELLEAWLMSHTDSLQGDGAVAVLNTRPYLLLTFCASTAVAAPLKFCTDIIPHLLRIMSLTSYPQSRRPYSDLHFAGWHPGSEPHELDDALIEASIRAVKAAAAQDVHALTPVLEALAQDVHSAAQLLLYHGLGASPQHFAEWTGEILLQGEHRLKCGYGSNSMWGTRQLLSAVSPHMSPDTFDAVEARVRDLRLPWEDPRSPEAGRYAFTLLSGLDEHRLSEIGRKRLGELRRRFTTEQPESPHRVNVAAIVSPISESAAARMGDDHWLRAMKKYNVDHADYDTHIGGVHELASVLQAQTARDPLRYAKLAVKLTADLHPAYADHLLIGLGNTAEQVDTAVVCDAIRHIRQLGQPDAERWLAWPLRRHVDSDIADDIIELVLDLAIDSNEPDEDRWPISADGQNSRGAAEKIHNNGINVARGQAAEVLGDLLIHDADGRRTAIIAPQLQALAADPSIAVRSCVAHLVGASLRHARPQAIAAFNTLIDADDRLLAVYNVERLVLYIMHGGEAALTRSIVERTTSSAYDEVRQTGGRLAARLALHLGDDALLRKHLASPTPSVRTGVAEVAAAFLPRNHNLSLVSSALSTLFKDENPEVRRAAAHAVVDLRGEALRQYRDLLGRLIDSPSFAAAEAQLLITLEDAPDRVDTLIMHCAKRFLDLHDHELGNFATAAAGDSRQVTNLLVRAYAQTHGTQARREILDYLDRLLLLNAFGTQEAVDSLERSW